MSFFGVELNAQLNRLMFEIKLHLAKNRYMPNIRTLYRSFVQYDPQANGLISGFYFEKVKMKLNLGLKCKWDFHEEIRHSVVREGLQSRR